MTQNTSNTTTFVAPRKPEKMVTLACKACRMALFMSDRVLHMPTWQCPSCGVVTKSVKL